MSFYDYWQKLDWSQLQSQIAASTAVDVARALQATRTQPEPILPP